MNSTAIIGVGLMCGTSQDALDICAAKYTLSKGKWSYEIIKTKAVEIPNILSKKLGSILSASAIELSNLNVDVGQFFGHETINFLKELKVDVDFIASHGITIFHQPENGLTLQIGSGAEIAAITGKDTVCDFRTIDVAHGGQGAPLVPFADFHLFNEFDYTLNLGGFCNLTQLSEPVLGFDITICNLALNRLSAEAGLKYDFNGNISATGSMINSLFNDLNSLEFFKLNFPKSLGKEWFDKTFTPVLEKYKHEMIQDRMFTVCEHIGYQIGRILNNEQSRCLTTGGGTFNSALINAIQRYSKTAIIVADDEIINYKEALCFGLLGACRITGQVNTFSSVTGAHFNSVGGAIYAGKATKSIR